MFAATSRIERMTFPPRKKMIEVALPLEAINRESAREKSIRHGHPSTLHLWWARRPLAAARAVLFASLVDDPSARPDRFPTEAAQEEEREKLFGIIKRLGLEAHASDLNPVAVLITKAMIEIPPKFAGRAPVNPADAAKIGGKQNW